MSGVPPKVWLTEEARRRISEIQMSVGTSYRATAIVEEALKQYASKLRGTR